MTPAPSDYEKLGQFYLGKEYDLETRKPDGGLVLYDSKDLVTHGVVLGMTGSGKTGLCMALLEEAAMDHVPAIVIDPKGDIANLLLMFPDLDAASFRPWVPEEEAAKKGMTPEELAEKTAGMWKKGLEDWGQSGDRIRDLKNRAEITIFTPGSRAGIPLSILGSLQAPSSEVMEDGELLGETIQNTVSSLLSLVGVNAETHQSPEAVLLGSIFQKTWSDGTDLDLETLIRMIQRPPFDKVGVIDLESFYPEKSRQTLALKFNHLLASPGFSSWLEGAPIDIGAMLHDPAGKPRISIVSIAHLGDSERMFVVSMLLDAVLGWSRSQRGTTSLRALLYMDEIFGFLPPTANPPSKKPMLTLLKQARASGLGCLLATQNPVDLDYKALSNIGTWFLGRLQTERDKMRVLDGLEGAAGSQNAKFDRKEVERILSGLGNRVFLMNNVHEDGPVLFHVRWVMSYLTGPLTRTQIKTLMDPKREALENGVSSRVSNPLAMPSPAVVPNVGKSVRPVVGSGVREWFARVSGDGSGVTYHPRLLRRGVVHFSLAKAGVEGDRAIALANPVLNDCVDWERSDPAPPPELLSGDPENGAAFAELPGFAMNAANYKQVEKDFAEWLFRNERAEIFFCPPLKAWSDFGETEGDFRTRLQQQAREARDTGVSKLRDTAVKKIATLETRLRTAEGQLAKQKAEANAAKMQAGVSVLGGILNSVLGRKSGLRSLGRGTSSIGKATSAYKQHQDVVNAQAKVDDLFTTLESLRKEIEDEAAKISEAFQPEALVLEKQTLKPTRRDVKVESVGLLWLPFDEKGESAW